jgi:TRAP-type C4-dicarboxylate transport system substrate-binding protein
MKRLAVLLVAALAAVPLLAAVDVKLATIAPPGTTWHKALLDMGATWSKTTEGRVTLTVFPGGVQGDEPSVLRKMRPGIEQVQSAFLTSGGLAGLDDAFNVFGIPFFFENDEEQLAVQKKLTPVLQQRLSGKGLHLLAWGTGGWVQIFSKKPLRSLKDVKDAKLYTTKGDDKMLAWFVSNGFHPVALMPADIPTQLKLGTGLIDTAPYPPYLAMNLQTFRDAKYMLDVHIAPLTGALVVANGTWNKISPEDRAKITTAAQTLEARIRTEAPALDASSIKTMTERGLEVIKLDPKALAEFRTEAARLTGTIEASGMVPADIYRMAVSERDAYRKSKGR